MSDDLARLAADLGSAHDRLMPQLVAVTEKSLGDVVRVAQTIVSVDTGYLKSSIGSDPVTSSPDTVEGVAGPTAEYGEYVEDGTSRTAPHPYMGPAGERVAPSWVAAIEESLDRVL